MRALPCAILVAVLAVAAAWGHPHAGGIAVRSGGTVFAGDILRSRLLVIGPAGDWREILSVGHVRDLEMSADETLYGVSQGSGLWMLGPGERPAPVMAGFHGLFSIAPDGSFVLAPADSIDRRPRLDLRSPSGRQSTLAVLNQIDALVCDGDNVVVADGSAVRRIAPDGTIRLLAGNAGKGLYGLTIGPNGPIVSLYQERAVIELPPDGSRRTLMTSEAPWAPTDVHFSHGALHVVEIAQHPCCWKGPRIRRVAQGSAPVTLVVFDDQDHFHLEPWDRPLEWLIVALVLATVLIGALLRRWRARASRRL